MITVMIKFRRNTRAGGKSFSVGQVASINKEDAQRLVSIGKAEYARPEKSTKSKK